MSTTHTTVAPQKSLASKNGKARPKPPQKESTEIDKFLIANATFAVWLIFLAFGGGILALYYAHIGYLPEVEWKASLIYLFIASIVGGVIGLLLTISLYLPGVIWSETLVFDPCLRFTYSAPHIHESDKEQACLRTIFLYLGLPFLLVLLLSHLVLLAGKVGYWLIVGALLGLTFFVMRRVLRHRMLSHPPGNIESENPKTKDKSKTISDANRHAYKLASLFTLSVLLNQISMYVVYWLCKNPARNWTFVILTLLCTIAVWIACHVVALRHRDYPHQAIIASFVAAGLLLFTADKFSNLSVNLMNHFGIGYYKRVNLLVNNDGKNIVDSLGVPKCGELQLCNVEILSKLGDQYYLRVGDTTYVTLPKTNVVAIRPLN